MNNYWVWLSTIKGIGSITARKLLTKFHTPDNIFYADKHELLGVKDIGEVTADRIINSRALGYTENILEKCLKHDIKLLCLDNPLYPDIAKSITSLPILLYYKGCLIEHSIGVGIVGTRRCTEYGKRVAVDAAEFLVKHNIPIISGMAKGIDSYAHSACLNLGGYTVAVLGNGLDICYPKEHEELMSKIEKRGCLLSEYPPGTKPAGEHFPERNKIIAAWSSKLLVVEAGEKSGALITAEYAKRFERKIFSVPSSIYSKEGIGSNKLIQSDAEMYSSPTQLLIKDTYDEGLSKLNRDSKQINVNKVYTPLELKVIEKLKGKSLTIDELILTFKDYKNNIIETISMMELEGKIKSSIGAKFTIRES